MGTALQDVVAIFSCRGIGQYDYMLRLWRTLHVCHHCESSALLDEEIDDGQVPFALVAGQPLNGFGFALA